MPRRNSKYLQIAAYIMLSFIFVFVIGIAKNCSKLPFSEKEGYSEGDTLDIALLYVPGSYYWHEDSLSGINHEIAANFESQMGLPVKIWPVTDPSNGLSKLEKGTFDILASLPLDNSIKNRFPVSESIFLDRLVLIQLIDTLNGLKPVNSSLDLNGKKVMVAAGSSAVNRLKNLAEEIGGNIEIEEAPEMSDELICLQVASGSVPLAVVNERVASALAKNYPNLCYDSSISFTQFQVWVFNPSDTLIQQKFNSWFESFKTTETYRNILEQF